MTALGYRSPTRTYRLTNTRTGENSTEAQSDTGTVTWNPAPLGRWHAIEQADTFGAWLRTDIVPALLVVDPGRTLRVDAATGTPTLHGPPTRQAVRYTDS